MKKLMNAAARAAVTALLLSGTAMAAEAGKPDADPAMWVVKDEDTTIYLFGTVHVLKPRTHWFDDGISEAFDASDELVMEIARPDPATPSGAPRSTPARSTT